MLLGRFAEQHIDSFSNRELALFEAILNNVDPDIYAWLSGREPVPAEMQSNVMKQLLNFTISIDKY